MSKTKAKTKRCIVAINHEGKYYVGRKFGENKEFQFIACHYNHQHRFSNFNHELRKEIAQQIQERTPFSNTIYTSDRIERAVSLYRSPFRHIQYATFYSNQMDTKPKDVYIPYSKNIRNQCDKETKEVLDNIRFKVRWVPFLVYILYAVATFLIFCTPEGANPQKIDFVSSVVVILCLLFKLISKIMDRIVWKSQIEFWLYLGRSHFRYLSTLFAFILAVAPLLFGNFLLRFNFPWSKLGIVMIFIVAIVDLFQSDL